MAIRFPHPVLTFSCIGHSLDHIFMAIYPTTVIAIMAEFDRPFGELIAFMTPSVFLFGAGAIPAGWMADRWSARGMLIIMFLGMGAASILTGLARDPFEVAFGLAAIGVFASIYHPVATAVVVRYATQRGRDLGINGVFGGIGIGSGPLIGGVLTGTLGWREAFIIPGIVSILVGLAFAWMVREIVPSDAANKHASGVRGNWREVALIFALIVIAGVCVSFFFQSETVSIPKIFDQRLTFLAEDPEQRVWQIGLFAALVFYFGAAAQYGGGLLADRFHMKWLVAGALFLQLPVCWLALHATGWPMFTIAVFMAVFTLGLQPVVDSLVAHYVPSAWHARAFGMRFLAGIVASSAAIPAIAWIHTVTGDFVWLFVTLGGIAAIGVGIASLLPSERRVAVAGGPAE